MRQKILIAEPRDIMRIGIRTILEQREQIADIYEALTCEEIQSLLHSYKLDFIFIHQSLVKELHILPMNKLILLVDEPEMDMFIEAYKCKVRGYLSTSFSSELLLAAMHTTGDICLLDPVFLPWIMECLFSYMQDAHEFNAFSHREREIVQLLKNGLDRKTIAQQLHISDATLKTHIKNITRKREDTHCVTGDLTQQEDNDTLFVHTGRPPEGR